MEGGIESGFTHVTPEEFKPRLLQLKGKKNVRVTQVPLTHESLNSGGRFTIFFPSSSFFSLLLLILFLDVFILDDGLELYQFQGSKASPWERQKGGQLCRAIDDERKGKPEIYVFSEGDKGDAEMDAFWKILGGEPKSIKSAGDGGKDEEWEKQGKKKLFRITDSSGKMTFKLVQEGSCFFLLLFFQPFSLSGKIFKSKLDTNDAFLLDVGNELIVWIGNKASKAEKAAGMQVNVDVTL